MYIAIRIGYRKERLGPNQYLVAALLALIPVATALYHLLTMDKPPLY